MNQTAPKKNIYGQLRIMIKPPLKEDSFRCTMVATKFAYFRGATRHSSQPIIMRELKFKRNPKHDSNGYLAIEIDPVILFEVKTGIDKVQYNPNNRSNNIGFEIYQKDTKGSFKKVRDVYGNWFYEGESPTVLTWGVTQGANGQSPDTKKVQQISVRPACTHTTDGAIEVAKYIVEEIKRNVKSPVVQNIRDWLAESARQRKDPTIWDHMNKAYGGHPDPFLQMALTAWAEKVGPKRDWDHKPKLYKDDRFNRNSGITVHRPPRPKEPETIFKSHYHKYKNYDYFYDVWSNIHYGYVGLSAGFDERTLIDGSNTQQILNYNTQGGDTIDDDTAIKIGFKLYEKFGKFAENLTYQDVLDMLDKTNIDQMSKSKQVHWCYNEQNPNRIKR